MLQCQNMDYKEYFNSKKVTVMGLGLLGRGLGVIKFLADCGADLIVTDLKTREELDLSLKKLSQYKNIQYVLGEHRLEDFRNRDFIIRAPNAPLDSIYLAEAHKNGVPVEMDASLFCKLAPAGLVTIGITGTRGKSTITQLLVEILKTASLTVHMGGNIKGVATLPLLKKVKANHVVVMELDSWQCQGFGESKISPNIAVFTTFMNDHMNYYQGDMDRYFADKANIYRFQKEDDILILGSQVASLVKKIDGQKLKQQIITPKISSVASWKLKMPGEHNLYNSLLAMTAAQALGVKDSVIKKVVQNFPGLPYRLELVGEVGGVKYINDTNATSPDGLYAALEAFEKYKGKIILLAGGTDAGLDLDNYYKKVSKYVKVLILFKGTATDKILTQLPQRQNFSTVVASSMKEAFTEIEGLIKKGDLVLLSPGAKSFGVFKNEYDRGDQFNKEVKKIK